MEKIIKYAVGILLIATGIFAEYALYMSYHLFERSFVNANIAILSGANIQDFLIPIIALIQGGSIAPITLSASITMAVAGIILITLGCQFILITKKNKSLKVLLSKSYWTNMDLSTNPRIRVDEKEFAWFDSLLVVLRLKSRKASKLEVARRRHLRELAQQKEMEKLRERAKKASKKKALN